MADRVCFRCPMYFTPLTLRPLTQGRGAPRGGRGGASATRGGKGPQPTLDKPKREAILDLAKYTNQRIRVKFTGGREGGCLSKSYMFCSDYLFSDGGLEGIRPIAQPRPR